ncbi:MAG TPA: RNA 2',3'-cyclic phosphodiesterase [Casimicrobiaceae bacterium]|nr:RNA 2',3'-cyclic phosphodiesterase [Casimicrobiaceae bacterium]
MATRIRLFYALWPDDAARSALARLAGEIARDTQGRAPRAENLHVTVAFLGAIERERIPSLVAIGELVAQSVEPFGLSLERLGGGSYSLCWFAPSSVPPALMALHQTLSRALNAENFTNEQRMFRPHVTLARNGVRRTRHGALPPIRWQVDSLVLASSTSAAGGSIYVREGEWRLRAHSTGTV